MAQRIDVDVLSLPAAIIPRMFSVSTLSKKTVLIYTTRGQESKISFFKILKPWESQTCRRSTKNPPSTTGCLESFSKRIANISDNIVENFLSSFEFFIWKAVELSLHFFWSRILKISQKSTYFWIAGGGAISSQLSRTQSQYKRRDIDKIQFRNGWKKSRSLLAGHSGAVAGWRQIPSNPQKPWKICFRDAFNYPTPKEENIVTHKIRHLFKI